MTTASEMDKDHVGPSHVPLLPLALSTLGLMGLSVVLWVFFALPCGWAFQEEIGGRCATSTSIWFPAVSVAVIPVAGTVTYLTQRWLPYLVCLALLFLAWGFGFMFSPWFDS